MRAFVGITDSGWFNRLSSMPEIDEVNFWRPSSTGRFCALKVGEPFLFKLHAPRNYIVGGGFFAYSTILPLSFAWDAFGQKNGAASLQELRMQIGRYRRQEPETMEDYQIGCILLEQPFFFSEPDWIPVPEDWKSNIVRGKSYDLTKETGRQLWEEVQLRLQGRELLSHGAVAAEAVAGYGAPTIVIPRLGQGSFRIIVTDAYDRRCSVTRERTLPALEAAHIKPFSESGPHRIDNGILFRSDIHRLFDAGYVTLSTDYRLEVSRRIREEFENGRDYYAMHGRPLRLPGKEELRPKLEFITWHNNNVFRG
jgi:putative restriction endonuclease